MEIPIRYFYKCRQKIGQCMLSETYNQSVDSIEWFIEGQAYRHIIPKLVNILTLKNTRVTGKIDVFSMIAGNRLSQ